MIIKKKSLLVALVSSIVICLVLVMTLVGYIVYLEFKDNELKVAYVENLQRLNARLYTKQVVFSGLSVRMEDSGALAGYPVIEGSIRNTGTRPITDIIIRAKILDRDGSVLYEVTFRPQEPSLGSSSLTKLTIPYLSSPPKSAIRPSGTLPFKKILVHCPDEILSELKKISRPGYGKARWSGRLEAEVMSIAF